MAWQQLTISSSGDQEQWLSDFLFENEALTVTLQDAEDQPILEPPPGSMPIWDRLYVAALFEQDKNLAAVERELSSMSFEWTTTILQDQDWIRAYLDTFKPQQFGDKLWVCPSWTAPPDADAVNVILDPGLAFGTGSHETTSMCMSWLAEQDLSNLTVTDFGCGSGILAIAAIKLGAEHATAVDIDPQALLATHSNAEKNNVLEYVTIIDSAEFSPNETDVLIANILAPPLIELKDQLADCVRPGGKIALSGILESQAESVLSAYRDDFDFDTVTALGDWVRLSGVKKQRKPIPC